MQKYALPNGLINYSAFCNNVETVFAPGVSATATVQSSISTSKFSDYEKGELTSIISDIKQLIKAHRILLKPFFQDFDPANTQHITLQQFGRVLKQLQLMPEEPEFELICKKYFDRVNTREVNYVKFCHDVDKPEDMFPGFFNKEAKKVDSAPVGVTRATKSNFFPNSTKGLNVLQSRFSEPPINIDNDPTDVENRLRAHVVMKRVRVNEFFRDFDKLRKGKVTESQFKAILSTLNFILTEEEFQQLIDKYQTPDNMVQYTAFVDSIDQAFTIKGIEKNPTLRVKPVESSDTIEARQKYLEFDDDERNLMKDILEAYRQQILVKRLNLKPLFQDFDITRCGHITKTQFVRVLNQLNIQSTEHVMGLLVKKYMDKGNANEVNYFEFCNDVDRPEDMFGVGRDFNHSYEYFPKSQPTTIARKEIVSHNPDDIEDILARIRAECKERRIRLSEFMRDFDRLRSGDITVDQFRIALNMGSLHFSQKEFDLLINTFPGKKLNSVAWRDFDESIESAFTTKNLEKRIDEPIGAGRTQTFYGAPSNNQLHSHKQVVHEIVQNFRQQLVRERLDPKSFFQTWDKHNHYRVSPKQFRQVLATFNFPLSDEQVVSVQKVFGNDKGEINYAEFLQRCNADDNQMNLSQSKTYSASFRTRDFAGETDLSKLMQKIKVIVKKDRIRLLEFFQDHDVLRKGYVPFMKFKGVLHSQKVQLTDEEYQVLIDNFSVPTDTNLINYKEFDDTIERVFEEKNLEKAPTRKWEEFKAPSILDPQDVLNDTEEKQLEACLSRLGVEVKNKRLVIKPFFQDKDKSNTGFVANTRFRSIFDFLKLYVTEAEFEIINKRFQAKAPNEINYVEFDHVLKRYSGDY